jgi:hypothetical protein
MLLGIGGAAFAQTESKNGAGIEASFQRFGKTLTLAVSHSVAAI